MQATFGKSIETIIFDLDGTLYQNQLYYTDYLRFMIQGTRWEAAYPALREKIEEVFRGDRLRMNAVYRLAPVVADTADELFEKLEGGLVPDIAYEELIASSEYELLGDGWSVMKLVGSALGLLDGARGGEIYLQTREAMVRRGLPTSSRLRDILEKLRGRFCTVLISNASKPLADEVLRVLGCLDIFDKTVYAADKPRGMRDALKKLECNRVFEAPETVLTVGDHALNDLFPLQRLGCKTLWINPFDNVHEPCFDAVVRTMDELVDFLEQLYRQKSVQEN